MNDEQPLLRTRDLTKIYPGVVANEAVDLEIWSGKIHSIIGENGAGKSTLVSILYGATRPDRGELFWLGEKVEAGHTKRFRELGISFVPQHVTLVEPFTVWENIVLGESRPLWSAPKSGKDLRQRAEQLNDAYRLELNMEEIVSEMALGKRQNVALLKALLSKPKLLILDEPTAILTPEEVQRLFGILRKLAQDGAAVILIAHKLAEVLELSDQITVLRKGQKVGERKASDTNASELAALMTGESTASSQRTFSQSATTDQAKTSSRPYVWLDSVSIASADSRTPSPLEDVSMKVFPGEIFGIAGIDGNGQRELFELITGDRWPATGMFEVLNHDRLPELTIEQRNSLGLRRVSEDRHHEGLALDLPILDNLVLQYAGQNPLSRKGWLKRGHWKEIGEKAKASFSIAANDLLRNVRTLSGGNQQKVVLARELQTPAKLLVVAQPTRGLDFVSADFVHQQLVKAAETGTAVVLISGDLDELLALSHQIGVLHRGKWMGSVPNGVNARETVGQLMAGYALQAEGATL
ncbi:ABC transporter ATP-binding protein [Pelagicoccus albus]|uniref:ABC transporter ATP-binding protein n=1 Tax=Pelagicoccus albus TaxID=415222 RepID=A0A7X1B911_9BACT|nr:ABC transporter ATP-binding protein [Pelagicoccus albus]MBC2607901.1 ABC transporter ATP-binding protein [Pelagicoccus albus]